MSIGMFGRRYFAYGLVGEVIVVIAPPTGSPLTIDQAIADVETQLKARWEIP